VPFQELFELRKKVKTRQQVRAAPFQTATPYRASTHRCIPVPRSPGEAAPVYTHEAPHRPAAHAALAAGRLKYAANGGSRLTTSAFERPCAVHGSPHVSSTIEMPWFYVVSGAYIEIASVSLYLVTTRYLYNITDDVVDVFMKQLSPSSLPTHGGTSRSARSAESEFAVSTRFTFFI
jgi:hypothetical protein